MKSHTNKIFKKLTDSHNQYFLNPQLSLSDWKILVATGNDIISTVVMRQDIKRDLILYTVQGHSSSVIILDAIMNGK